MSIRYNALRDEQKTRLLTIGGLQRSSGRETRPVNRQIEGAQNSSDSTIRSFTFVLGVVHRPRRIITHHVSSEFYPRRLIPDPIECKYLFGTRTATMR